MKASREAAQVQVVDGPFGAPLPNPPQTWGTRQLKDDMSCQKQGGANDKIPDFWGGGVGSGWGSENFWLTFVLGTLEARKHNVDNVNNVQYLIIVAIGEILSPGEETRAAASISVHSYTDVRHSTARETYG